MMACVLNFWQDIFSIVGRVYSQSWAGYILNHGQGIFSIVGRVYSQSWAGYILNRGQGIFDRGKDVYSALSIVGTQDILDHDLKHAVAYNNIFSV